MPVKSVWALLETASIAIIVVDSSGKILLANQKTSEIFGYTGDELEGKSVNELLPEQLREAHVDHLQKFFMNPHPRPMGLGLDLTAQRASGELFPIEVSLSGIETENGLRGVAFIADISTRIQIKKQRQALIEQEERMNALRLFIGNMAHDLKTPMASILTRLHILGKVTDGANQSHIDLLGEHVRRLDKLVDSMLLMTRLDAIDVLPVQSANLNRLVDQLVSSMRRKIESKALTLEYLPDNSIPDVKVNQEYLQIAIQNVLDNALDYTPAGGTITIKTFTRTDTIGIEIRDTGIGIPGKDIDFIFDRFYRVERARTTNVGLNGLGLSIGKRIIDLHKGQIEVMSKLRQGTTIRISLPVQ